MNLRSDQTFVEDDGWHRAAERYEKFIKDHKKQKTVFLELGVGYNTPDKETVMEGFKELPGVVCSIIGAYCQLLGARSEERRVGKECRSRWSPYH